MTINEQIKELKNTIAMHEGNASSSVFHDSSIDSGMTALIQALLAINANLTLQSIYQEDIASALVTMVPA